MKQMVTLIFRLQCAPVIVIRFQLIKNVDPASTLRHFLSVSNFNQYNSVLYVNHKQLDLVMSGSVCEVTRRESPMVPEDSHNTEDTLISDLDLSMVMLCGICST